MYYAYVIRSLKDNSLYKGHCENINERIKQHNSGTTRSIKKSIPFEVIYYETFESRDQARKREVYLKTAAGRRFLKQKLSLE